MIDFQGIRNIVTPRGEVAVIARGAEILWRKQKYKRELLYLESTGEQYIDTEYNPNTNSKMTLDFQPTEVQSTCYAGRRYGTSGSGYYRAFTINSGSNGALLYAAYADSGNVSLGDFTQERQTITISKDAFIRNGVTTEVGTDTELAGSYTVYLFACNTNGAKLISTCRIYSCKIWDNEVLVRDIIPVLDWNDVPCMYDKVTGELFYNLGTGEFKYAELSGFPSDYKEVAYLESTGEQWIDMQYPVTSGNIELRTKLFVPSVPDAEMDIFGFYRSSYGGAAIGFIDNQAFIYSRNKSANDGRASFPAVYTGNDYTFEINALWDYENRTKYLTINGERYASKYNGDVSQNPNVNPKLFACNTSADNLIGKMYYFQLYDNGVLVRDFVPCYRKSDKKPGMYDLVSDTFFTNAGTGEFICGSDI